MVYQASHLDATFSALADPTRREILARLAAGDKTIGELAGRFDMSLPAVSKHVHILERAGLALVRREGRSRRTRLVAAPMRQALEWIERYRAFWEFQLDQLSAYLEDPANSAPASTSAGTPAPTPTPSLETAPWPHPQQPKPHRRSKSGVQSARRANGSSTRGRGRKK